MTGTIRVGMSGFSYPEWIGEIYPVGTKRDRMLSTYAEIFPAVEINMTFRRRPQPNTMDKWRDAVRDGFVFSMKANAGITHYRRLVGVSEEVAEFVKVVQRLGPRLGPILFQTHPKMHFDEAVLDAFCTGLVPGIAYAFEPRHESFMSPPALAVLKRHGVALCLNDDLFEPASYAVTAPFAYFRFHRDTYDAADLDGRAEQVKRVASDVDVYAFFAHEDNPESVKPALRFQELVR